MVVHDSCEEGTYQITELFLYPVGELAVDPRIYILIQKEAIRKFNLILDKIPAALKKNRKILTSQEASDIMIKLAGQILDSGDFDFQTALMEALCRMTTPNQRKDLADQWFNMEHVASAFVKIRDSEFETDCRKFLNLVNGMQGDRRRVYSYPCLEAYMDKHELLMPADEKLEEFWIDFNLGSNSISIYFSLADGEPQWETICITENEVKSYTITEEGKRYILRINLSEVVVIGAVEGSNLTIHFSSSLDILHAACSVYGQSKNKSLLGKARTSIVETRVQIKMEENSSQVVPESQVSLGEQKKNVVHHSLPGPSASAEMVTPARMKIFEASIVLNSSTGKSVNCQSSFAAVHSTKGKGKPSLEMVRSCDNVRATPKICSLGTITDGMVEQSQSDTHLEKMASRQTGKKKKSIPESKGVGMVQVGQKEQTTEPTCVPDTQPISRRNLCSSGSKPSVSEHCFKDQEGRSSKQTSLVPVFGSVSQKQLHREVTQHPQKLVSERNQSSAQPNHRANSVDRSSTGRSNPQELKAQTDGMSNVKNKGQMLRKVDASLIRVPSQASTTRVFKDRKSLGVKAETKKGLSNKEKRDAELTGNMVKSISSRYGSTSKDAAENLPKSRNAPSVFRPNFNMTWLSAAKKDVAVAGGPMRVHKKPVANITKHKEDVFTFNPQSSLNTEINVTDGKDKTFPDTSATLSSGIHGSSAVLLSTKKRQPVAKEKRHVKKHLFSDTDTDYAMTEVSWLRESSRKPKPKVAKYSRQISVKPKVLSAQTESPDLTMLSEKLSKCNNQPRKNNPVGKKRRRQPKKMEMTAGPTRPHAARRRPQRAAATCTKSYKEQDTDDSQAEPDTPSVPKSSPNADTTHEAAQATKKKTGTKSLFKSCTKQEKNTNIHSKVVSEQPLYSKHQRAENVVTKTSKIKKKIVSPAQEQMKALTDSQPVCQSSSSPSSPLIEVMRSAERSDPTCSHSFTLRGSPLPASTNPSSHDSLSPILLLPKSCFTVNSKENIKPFHFNSTEKTVKSQFIQPPPTPCLSTPVGKTLGVPNAGEEKQNLSIISPAHLLTRPPSLPLLTSTLLEQRKPSLSSPSHSPFPKDTVNRGSSYGFNKVYSVSQISLSLSSPHSSMHITNFNDSPTDAPGITTEKSPSSNLLSGPSRKRQVSLSSDFEEDDKEEMKKSKMRGQHSPRMKPRKLFQSSPGKAAKSEINQVTCSSRLVSSWHWGAEEGHEDVYLEQDLELPKGEVTPRHLCQKFSSELKEKLETRYKITEIYNKQSLKTIQHHTFSLNRQVASDRTQRHQQLQEFLMEEISKLEQNDTVLKNIEKDLAMSWKKQTIAFHSFKEQESRRNKTMKNAFQSNLCHSLEYEEKVFTSQMCLIKKDMKSVQGRLLSQMQKEEIQSVKKSLHALFFP
ncbi:synaptonemal complex protein 2 [Antennarius striatus]|uniref:synaptonemal complex protein 2 n=1 Tax=Antennarius striatus TaxID=241820 RepID=UPI0035B387A9